MKWETDNASTLRTAPRLACRPGARPDDLWGRTVQTLPYPAFSTGGAWICAVLVSGLVNVAISHDVSHIYGYSSNRALAAVSVQLHGLLWVLVRLCGPLGMWVAAASLLWHMCSTRAAAPEDRRGRR